MFDDILLLHSAVDRGKNAAYDLIIDGKSYRPRLKPKFEDTTDGVDPDTIHHRLWSQHS